MSLEENLCPDCDEPMTWTRVDGRYDSYGMWLCWHHEPVLRRYVVVGDAHLRHESRRDIYEANG